MGGVWSYHKVLQIQGMLFANYFDIDGLQTSLFGDALNGTPIMTRIQRIPGSV